MGRLVIERRFLLATQLLVHAGLVELVPVVSRWPRSPPARRLERLRSRIDERRELEVVVLVEQVVGMVGLLERGGHHGRPKAHRIL